MAIIPQQDEISTLSHQVQTLTSNTVLGYYHHRAILNLMTVTGARVSDALASEHWEILPDGNVVYYAQKNQTYIELPETELPANITEILEIARTAAARLSYEDIARYVKAYQPYKISTSGRNNLRTHVFRYFFAKKKKSEGKNIVQIAQMIGDTQLRTAGYIEATLKIM